VMVMMFPLAMRKCSNIRSTVFYAFILWENITSIYWKPMNLVVTIIGKGRVRNTMSSLE